MREILFRGKVVKSDPDIAPADGWVEGFYYQDLCGGEVKHFIVSCPCTWEVVPATVGQYTGLKDKNGKEIYEDDILLDESGAYAVVSYLMGSFCVDFGEGFDLQYFTDSIHEICYVAGNIHDNPELQK